MTSTAEADLARLYEDNYPRFLRVAAAMLGDSEQARDAVHDAFVRAVSGIERFRGDSSLETWVWRILTNACLTEQRREVAMVADPGERPDLQLTSHLAETIAPGRYLGRAGSTGEVAPRPWSP